MKKIIILIILLFVSADANTPHSLSSAYHFGGYASYNMRDTYRKIDALDEYLTVENNSPVIYGATIGRRRPMKNPRWRSAVTAECGWGQVQDNEFPVLLTNGATILATEHSRYITGGVVAEWHYLFPSARQNVFLTFGAGMHVTSFSLTLHNEDGDELTANGYGSSHGTFSPSGNIGIGVEQKNTNRRGMALVYNFRIWQPARFIETGVLFPMGGVIYMEYFYSHSVSLQILIPGLERGSRF